MLKISKKGTPKRVVIAATALAGAIVVVSSTASVNAQSRDYRDPVNGHLYRFVPGAWTQEEACQIARSQGGYPVVFSSLSEHKRVVSALNFGAIAPAWTGHSQAATGREPGGGWKTYTGETSAPIDKLFNGTGPDDGIKNNHWGFTEVTEEDGTKTYYLFGPSDGKDEDGAVIWHDNNGLLEDVSRNQKCGVVIEFNNSSNRS